MSEEKCVCSGNSVGEEEWQGAQDAGAPVRQKSVENSSVAQTCLNGRLVEAGRLREGLQASPIMIRRGFLKAYSKDHHRIYFVIWCVRELPET